LINSDTTECDSLPQKKSAKTNIVFIGMAGAGKSTVGKELAPLLGLKFVDVDILIEEDQKMPLQKLLEDIGVDKFREVEEKILLSIECQQHVIATGGSAIYSQAGLSHLQKNSVMVLLDVELEILKQRVDDFSSRGLVKTASQSFTEVFQERQPLYLKNADLIIRCHEHSVADICASIMVRLSDSSYHF